MSGCWDCATSTENFSKGAAGDLLQGVVVELECATLLPSLVSTTASGARCELLDIETASDATKAEQGAEKFRNVFGHCPLDVWIWIKLLGQYLLA